MQRRTDNKIVLIVRKTRLEELVARFNTIEQAKFYVEHLGADFTDYLNEDRQYKESVRLTQEILERQGRLQTVTRGFVPNFIFGPRDTVVAVGQDGLVANVLKYLDGQPLIGVNPDRQRYEGILVRFSPQEMETVVPQVFAAERTTGAITMAQVSLNTGETLLGVNDLFIGPKSHTSALYHISHADRSEFQSSSGIIVSTGLGRTGWFRSIVAGANGIAWGIRGKQPKSVGPPKLEWDADELFYSVREPWPSKTSGASMVFGKIDPHHPLVIESRMPEHGVIFSDGIEADYLRFNSGTKATIGLSPKKGKLVI